jgi:hypothetical protein
MMQFKHLLFALTLTLTLTLTLILSCPLISPASLLGHQR